ncbi:Wadjet anti-phage system protein JetD domain-containing protein [Roseimicrobium sp. ORNL1]|uniref:Wadjet anti-phage system protein JetD domain-containing protein n=1 Tax=Roseimicrobium sp. ORNL1 TaxID=2711231 RepID=UPI0013E17BB3|nr:Wadjet anti-phage system protein JetD domain-containing protein [Roseimicrobium sp. ORNL1]QIF00241.1 hypothetical protein G5S37_01445 [Roseimicrobium sp. ORNL1]
MKPPAWLRELHRQWQSARGARAQQASRTFTRGWEDLLDAAGIMSADERLVAEREAIALEREGRLKLVRHRYRKYRVEKVALPLESEAWLVGLFGEQTGGEKLEQCVAMLKHWNVQTHPRFPESWGDLCHRVSEAMHAGKSVRPFSWRHPRLFGELLGSLYALTSREWPPGTHMRVASEELGWGSKALEEHRAALEAGLGVLFGEPSPLESLGLVCTRSHARVQGPLTLHFEDGTAHTISNLQGETTITHADLQRATHITTTAARLLSIENSKSTFADACAVNRSGDTLLLATSYPNAATLRLLELLPEELPHVHFGDTDVSGYAILRALRQQSARPVQPFLMAWEDDLASKALSEHDLRLLPMLLEGEVLADCREHLERMKSVGRKGRFEQERYGMPRLLEWPFWNP